MIIEPLRFKNLKNKVAKIEKRKVQNQNTKGSRLEGDSI